jgi:hypothetical protein
MSGGQPPDTLATGREAMPQVYEKNGTLIRSYHDDTDGSFVLATEQDLEDLIEENKRLRENQTGKEQFRLCARIPVHVVEKAMRDGSFHDDEFWKNWANDPENRDFRVWEGRL